MREQLGILLRLAVVFCMGLLSLAMLITVVSIVISLLHGDWFWAGISSLVFALGMVCFHFGAHGATELGIFPKPTYDQKD